MTHSSRHILSNYLLRDADNSDSKRPKFAGLDCIPGLHFWTRVPVGAIALDRKIPVREIEVDDVATKDFLCSELFSLAFQFLAKGNFQGANTWLQLVPPHGCAMPRTCHESGFKRRFHLADFSANFAGHNHLFFIKRMGLSLHKSPCGRITFFGAELTITDSGRDEAHSLSTLAASNLNSLSDLHRRESRRIEFRSAGIRAKSVRVLWPFDLERMSALFTVLGLHIKTPLGKAVSEWVGTVRETVRRTGNYSVPSPLNSSLNYTKGVQ